jgi:hypothetical protein
MTKKDHSYGSKAAQAKFDKDEADAEKRYLKALDEAIKEARAVEADAERTESERIAAEQAANALTEVDMARTYAANARPEVAAKTFVQTLREWLQGR